VRTSAAVTAVRRTPSGTYPWEVDTNVTTTPAHSVIFATPATITGRLVGVQDPRLDALQRVVSASAAMVTFAIARDQLTLPVSGTGVLVPLATPWRDGGSMMVTAITLLDRKWPRLRRDDDVVLRAHVGRIDDTRSRDMDDETLTARVRDELSVVLPRFATPYETRVQRWPDGLPQYYVGHARLVADAKSAADSIGVSLCGITYDGVGVPAGVGSGRRAANEVIERLSARAGAD
jgi:oxygen-dependent protoporphyrinogen oxidase